MIDKQKHNWDHVAEQIYLKYHGIVTSDGYQIHCPCPDHEDNSPSCKITPLADKIMVRCYVCDELHGVGTAYSALKAAGDIPFYNSNIPYHLKIWNEATQDNFAIGTYLSARGLLETHVLSSLRLHDELPHSETAKDKVHVAILASLTNAAGHITGTHRTYLNDDGDAKLAGVNHTKKLVNGDRGDRVVLRDGTQTVHLGEGIETTIAVLQQLPSSCNNHAIWAATTAPKLRAVEVDSSYSTIHIWADHDKSTSGINAARALAQRLYAQKRTVYIHLPDHVTLGTRKSVDWLDELTRISSAFASGRKFAPTRWEEDDITMPTGFQLTDDGLMMTISKKTTDSDNTTQKVLSRRQIWVSARCPSVDDDTSKCEITYFNPDNLTYCKAYISTGALSSTRQLHSELMVSNSNFTIDHKMLPHLCSYLHLSYENCSTTRLVASHTGWIEHEGSYVHALYDPQVSVHAHSAGEKQLIAAYHTRGSYEKWKTEVLDKVITCKGMSFVFATTLAAPLFRLFGLASIPIPMVSNSGDGKTLSAYAALSAWCHPKQAELSGSSSLVGLRNALGCLQDVPTLIDEVQLKAKESLGTLIYEIGNSGKAFKGTRDGGLRDSRSIQTTTLFTGECSMSGSTLHDGGNVRLIQLEDIDFIAELRHDIKSIKRLGRATRQHYGHFGPEFIAEIRSRYDSGTLLDLFETCEDSFTSENSMQQRQSPLYGSMKTGCIILGDLLGEHYATPLITALHEHWDVASTKREPDLIGNRALQLVKDYVVSHRADFGEIEEGVIREHKGEWQDDGRLAIIGSEFDRILGKFDSSEVKRTWKKHGHLCLTKSEFKRGYLGRARVGVRKNIPGCVILSAKTVSDIRPEGLVAKVF